MGTFVKIKASDGHEFEAYQATPNCPPRGGIVVIQEVFGVNDHICNIADRFSEVGYLAIAPALFDRFSPGFKTQYSPADITQGRNLKDKANNNFNNVILDVDAARKTIAQSVKRIGIVGFCWGGVVAWASACRLNFCAASSYYGGGLLNFVDESPNCPVIFHFGDLDRSIPLDIDVVKIQETHPNCPVHIYAADHGFNCDMRSQYNSYAAHVSGMRTIILFEQ